MSIFRLMASAAKSAQVILGHTLKWVILDDNRAKGECVNCGKYVYVNTKPSPNDIDIGGPAIALNCGSN